MVAEDPSTNRFLFVISRQQPQLYEYVRSAFSPEEEVRVIVDRRVADRRRASAPGSAERRRSDRRVRTDVVEELKARGCAFVPAGGGPALDSQIVLGA